MKKHYLSDDGTFPNNSALAVLLYKGVLNLPSLFPALFIQNLFRSNNWFNTWNSGIYEYHHYHSITHEVMCVYKGSTILILGGEKGTEIKIEKGDVLIIPAV